MSIPLFLCKSMVVPKVVNQMVVQITQLFCQLQIAENSGYVQILLTEQCSNFANGTVL